VRNKSLLLVTTAAALLLSPISSQTVTKIVDHGPDGQRLVFAVLGDGYQGGEQKKFAADVSALLTEGMLKRDFYLEHAKAFNVYRVDIVSKDSGVSTPTRMKDTALKVIFSGDWNRCWVEESTQTDQLINNALLSLPKYDFVLVMANEPNYGGCRRGSRLYVTSGDQWDVLAHEYGHAIGNLYDEYSVQGMGSYMGTTINSRNCTTMTDSTRIIWRDLVGSQTQIPTIFDNSMDPQSFVGAFEGCSTFEKHVYRPAFDCRMRSNTPIFCPICRASMELAVSPYMAAAQSSGHLSIEQRNPGASEVLLSKGATSFLAQNTQPRTPPPPAHPTEPQQYLSLVVRVKRDGSSTVIKQSLVSGPPILRQQGSSDFAYALSQGTKTVSTEFLPEDPFVVRGFADPKNGHGEKYERADEATIVIKVPAQQAKAFDSGKISLQIVKINPDALVSNFNGINLSSAILDQLKARKALTTTVDVTSKRLAAAVRENAKATAAIK